MEQKIYKNINEVIFDYNSLREKHNLPDWNYLDNEFEISAFFRRGRGLTLRDIRNRVGDKISFYSKLLESFISPQGVQMFVMNTLKKLSEEDWDEIKRIYKIVSKNQLRHLNANTVYSEEKDIGLLKESVELWESEKNHILKIIETLEQKYSEESSEDKKSYYG